MADGDSGSREYVRRIVAALGPHTHKSTHITGLRRAQGGVVLGIAGQGEVWFDKVILAAHGITGADHRRKRA